MRRTILAFTIIGLLIITAAVGQAQSAVPAAADSASVLVAPTNLLEPEITIDEMEPVIAGPRAGAAGDSCSSATDLVLSFALPADGGATQINRLTEEGGDPVLACTWGNITRSQGYRTAWYKFVATDTGQVTVTTRGSEFDTIMAVFAGQCDALLQIACSDDYGSLQSQVSFQAIRNETYYIEVADYHYGISQPTNLAVSAYMDGMATRWNRRPEWTMPLGGLSRHMLASYDRYIFVIGGQTQIQGIPTISNAVQRFDAFDQQWQVMANIPGPGLSNTTAAQMGGKIYVPGGFDGNTTSYSNSHLVYHINADEWRLGPAIPTALLPDGKMFAWAAAAAESSGRAYYVSGGITSLVALDPEAEVSDTVLQFTPATNSWKAMPPMTTPRYAHTGVWLDRENKGFCVAGGISTGVNTSGTPIAVLLTNAECFDPEAGSWVPTGPLNFPRYSAGSAIGPDGNWYIFGGMDASGAVAETEVYDPMTNTWVLLDSSFSLGGRPTDPARAWPRGAFIGNNLWIFGGNDFPERRVISDYRFLPLPGAVVALPNRVLVPFASNRGGANFLNDASPIGIGDTATGNFSFTTQFFNPYFFDWPLYGRATVRLGNIPTDSNFNVWLYDGRKLFLGRGDPALYGGQKSVSRTLQPGRYYILIERIYPKDLPDPADYYTVTVTREPGR